MAPSTKAIPQAPWKLWEAKAHLDRPESLALSLSFPEDFFFFPPRSESDDDDEDDEEEDDEEERDRRRDDPGGGIVLPSPGVLLSNSFSKFSQTRTQVSTFSTLIAGCQDPRLFYVRVRNN